MGLLWFLEHLKHEWELRCREKWDHPSCQLPRLPRAFLKGNFMGGAAWLFYLIVSGAICVFGMDALEVGALAIRSLSSGTCTTILRLRAL